MFSQTQSSYYSRSLKLLALFSTLIVAIFNFQMTTNAQQPPSFEAILYNPNVGEFIVVDESGNELERTPLPSLGSQVPSENISISENGQRIAYVLRDTNAGVYDLMIYDRQQNAVAMQYRIPNSGTAQSVNHSLSSYLPSMQNSSFDDNGRYFAFSYNTDFTTWEVIVLDVDNNIVRNRLTNQNVTFPSGNPPNGNLAIPRHLDGQFLYFTFITTNTGGAPEYPSYQWDTGMNPNNNLSRIETYRTVNGDYLNSVNHQIMAAPDYRLPNVQHQVRGPAVQFNTLHAATTIDGQTFPIFNTETLTLSTPRFIQNGNLVIVKAETYPQYGNVRWLVIDPSTGQQQMNLGINDLVPHNLLGLPDGLLYSAPATDIRNATGYQPSPNAATTALMYINTSQNYAGDAGQRIWLGEVNRFAQLVHVTPRMNPPITPPNWNSIPVDNNVEPYQPGRDCNQDPDNLCGEQTTTSSVIDNPCVTMPLACDITLGDLIRINTTEGDVVNLRSFPNVDADNIVAQLPNSTDGQVISGPETADGFTWWEIETNNGEIGWIVERVNDVQVLIKIDPTTGQPVGSGSSTGQLGGGNTFALTPGGQAMVTPQGDNLNARIQPTVNSRVLAILQAGQIVDVLSGPVQADGFTWWEVDTSEGAAWVADGDGNDTWLSPTTQSNQQQNTISPVARFNYQINGATVTFTSTTTGDVRSIFWTFGDGQSSTDTNPSHTYQSTGTYTVTLTVTGEDNSQDSFTQQIAVNANSSSETVIDMQNVSAAPGQLIATSYFSSQGIASIQGAPQGTYCSTATSIALLQENPVGNILTTADPTDIRRCNTVPIAIVFSTPQQSVELTFTGAEELYELVVFDTNGNLLATQTQQGILNGTTTISHTSNSRNISRVRFGYQTGLTGITAIRFE